MKLTLLISFFLSNVYSPLAKCIFEFDLILLAVNVLYGLFIVPSPSLSADASK